MRGCLRAQFPSKMVGTFDMPRNSREPVGSSQLNRRSSFKESNRIILVVCEGEKTEPNYLAEFPVYERIHGLKIKSIGLGCDPEIVVDRVILERDDRVRAKRKDATPIYDEVWAVFDIDEHDTNRLESAVLKAREAGIKTAISNPCFELWILLHFEDHFSAISSQGLEKRIRFHVPNYKKYVCYRELKVGRDHAIRRAKALEKQHERDGSNGNPSTTMWQLVAGALRLI
jgi:hypothetical protein